MKTRHILAAAITMAASALGFSSCDGSEDLHYSQASAPQGQRIYFASSAINEEVGDDATSVTVELFRPAATAAEAYTVQLAATTPEDLIHVPSEATFAAGDTVTQVTVSFNAAELASGKVYPVTITVDEAQANEYGISTVTINITHLSWSEWAEMGAGVYTFTMWYEGDCPAKVMERHLSNNPDAIQYRFLAALDEEDPETYYLYLEASTEDGGETIIVPQQTVGEHPAYGDVYMEDVYSYTGDPSYAPESYYDQETGLFTLYLICYCDAGSFGDTYEYCQLDGFADHGDYTLTLTAMGQVNVAGQDFAIVSLLKGADIATVKYTVAEGSLSADETAALAEKIAAGDSSVETAETSASGNIALSPETAGDNTLVAVGFNKAGEQKATASLTFSYGSDAPAAKVAPRRLSRR